MNILHNLNMLVLMVCLDMMCDYHNVVQKCSQYCVYFLYFSLTRFSTFPSRHSDYVFSSSNSDFLWVTTQKLWKRVRAYLEFIPENMIFDLSVAILNFLTTARGDKLKMCQIILFFYDLQYYYIFNFNTWTAQLCFVYVLTLIWC